MLYRRMGCALGVCAQFDTYTQHQSPMRGASALPNQRLGRDTPETAIGAPTLSALHKLQAPTPTASASSSEEGSVRLRVRARVGTRTPTGASV